MIEALLPRLCTPRSALSPVSVAEDRPVELRGTDLFSATLVGPGGADPSKVVNGIWEAMGDQRAPRMLAQLSNVVPPVPQLYERLWRTRSLGLLSGRPFPVPEELAELDQALGDVAGSVIVDVGCSEGLYARHLAARGAKVLAVDHSRAFLRRADRRATRCGVAIGLTRATAQHLPLVDGGADAVVIGGSLNEIGDLGAAIGEAARVLPPGGRAFVMSLVRATTGPGRVVQRVLRPTGIVFPTIAQTEALFVERGFSVVERRLDRIVARTTLVRST